MEDTEYSKEYLEFIWKECMKLDGEPSFDLWSYLRGHSFNMRYLKKAK